MVSYVWNAVKNCKPSVSKRGIIIEKCKKANGNHIHSLSPNPQHSTEPKLFENMWDQLSVNFVL